MTAKDILKLIDAGFTKDEIFKFDAGIVPDPAADNKKDPEPEKQQPKTEASAPEIPSQQAGVILSDDQFKKLLQQLNVNGASLDVPPETDMASKLGEHFKELMVGK